MDVKIEEVSPVERELSFVVPAEEVDKTLSKIFKDLRKEAKLKGFRKGKAPESVIRAHFREYAVKEAENQLVAEHYRQALMKHEIPVVSSPEIHFDGLKEGRDFQFKAKVEIIPKLPELSGYERSPVKSRRVEVRDVDVDNAIERMRGLQGKLVGAEKGYAARNGDYLIMDYEGEINGEPFEDNKKTDALHKLGSPDTLPEFDKALMGAKAGEVRSFTLTYPEDFPNNDLAGKEASFKIVVKEVKRLELPELDDAFAKGFGDFEDMAAFREFVKERLEKEREEMNRQWMEEQILTFLLKRFAFEVPRTWITKQAEYLLRKYLDDQKRQGAKVEEVPLSKHPQKKVFEELAERQVKSMLLLDGIAKKEKLEVKTEDLNAHYEKMAKETGIGEAQIRNYYTSNQEQLGSLKEELLRNKTLAYLRERAVVEWVEDDEERDALQKTGEDSGEKSEEKGKIILP